MHSRATEYLQIIRVVYISHISSPCPGYARRARDVSKLSVKVFSPVRLRRSQSVSSEEDITEACFEDLTQLQDRVNGWLLETGQLTRGHAVTESNMAKLQYIYVKAIGYSSIQ